jgi:hypothetical protein
MKTVLLYVSLIKSYNSYYFPCLDALGDSLGPLADHALMRRKAQGDAASPPHSPAPPPFSPLPITTTEEGEVDGVYDPPRSKDNSMYF